MRSFFCCRKRLDWLNKECVSEKSFNEGFRLAVHIRFLRTCIPERTNVW